MPITSAADISNVCSSSAFIARLVCMQVLGVCYCCAVGLVLTYVFSIVVGGGLCTCRGSVFSIVVGRLI